MIGKDQTIKIILSSYIAILTSDAMGNLISRIIGEGGVSGVLVIPSENKAIITIKIVMFIFLTIALTTRGAFDVLIADEKSHFMRTMMMFSYGILSAGLIISTILVYISGASLISAGNLFLQDPVQSILQENQFVRLMVQNYSVWFSLPAIAFVISSLFGKEN
jgi:hypothetical protein